MRRHTQKPAPGLATLLMACACTGGEANIPEGKIGISDLRVTENPSNPLSFFVSFRTHTAVQPELSVKCGAEYERTFKGESSATKHEVFVMGLLVGLSCDIQAMPTADTVGEASTRFDTTPSLDGLPVLDVQTIDENRMQPGWTVFSLAKTRAASQFLIVAIDAQGRYRWMFSPGEGKSGAGAEVKVIEGGLLVAAGAPHLFGVSWEGEIMWRLDERGHHDLRISPWNENHLLYLGFNGGDCGEHNAVEYDLLNRTVIWDWPVCEHWTPIRAYRNWSHLNTIEPFPEERALLISSRDQDALFKVSRDSGQVQWVLGRGGDFDMGEPGLFLRQHAPEVLPSGNILLFDNGLFPGEAEDWSGLPRSEGREYSRVLEYELTYAPDGAPSKANVVWEYTDTDIFAVNRSEADRLANGNTLIHYVWVQPDREVILREVTSDRDIVWNVVTPPDTSSYRSERIDARYGWIVEP